MAARELVELDQARRMVLDVAGALPPTPVALDAAIEPRPANGGALE
jgi:hypothetical protein